MVLNHYPSLIEDLLFLATCEIVHSKNYSTVNRKIFKNYFAVALSLFLAFTPYFNQERQSLRNWSIWMMLAVGELKMKHVSTVSSFS